jgi:hypothetical protein
MNVKGYLSTLIIILALFGIYWESTSVPNQEIVVQFDDGEVTFDEAQIAIAIVKKQLQELGVENIQVFEGDDGGLKITYYSAINVAEIKRAFSEEEKLELGYITYGDENEPFQIPSEKTTTNYKLNVCEIHVSPDAATDFNGYLPKITSGHDSYLNPIVYLTVDEIDVRERNRLDKVAYTVHRNIALLIDTTSHNIPEVRAGPAPNGIS